MVRWRPIPDQDLPIQLYVGLFHGGYELTVTAIVLSDAGIESCNPQLAPIPLLDLPITVGILPCLLQPTNRNRTAILRTTTKSLRLTQNRFMLCM
jgi:hypothetical protein